MKLRLVVFFIILSVVCSCRKDDDAVTPVPEPPYEGEIPNTGLPVVVINTPDSVAVTSKDSWVEHASITIVYPDRSIVHKGTTSIKGRGNSTWEYFPKKPYSLKLDKRAEILGMPAHRRWCLLANWLDRTLMRNAVGLRIASLCPALDWTPSGRFVEVVLNGEHLGNYFLCEQIRVDKNRVNVAELDENVTEGEGITGGYIMELDTYFDEQYKFRSEVRQLPWMFKDPDEVNEAQFEYLRNYVNEMESALYDDTKFAKRLFVNYMDLESFADWWLASELIMNAESGHPKSCYMHKDKNGLMKAGPVWDLDWHTFVPGGANCYTAKNTLYYPQLFKDKAFRTIVKNKWIAQKASFESVVDYFDELASQLRSSDSINHEMWPIIYVVCGDENLSFDDAVQLAKQSYQAKLLWLDGKITSW